MPTDLSIGRHCADDARHPTRQPINDPPPPGQPMGTGLLDLS